MKSTSMRETYLSGLVNNNMIMETQILRQQLLNNITQMCEYVERELSGTTRRFEYKYEYGFVYGWMNYNISFSYSPANKHAEMSINFYRGHEFFSYDNKVFSGSNEYHDDKDITNSFLTNSVWCDASNIQKAMEITQRNWPRIKDAIEEHKREDNNIFNFKV